MKVNLDKSSCIGCGSCVAISPENFEFDEDGLSELKDDKVIESTRNAVEACPVSAISIEEE